MSLNSRVQWIVTPGRVVFLVLDQGFHTDDGSFRAGRTVPVIKIGWTFRF